MIKKKATETQQKENTGEKTEVQWMMMRRRRRRRSSDSDAIGKGKATAPKKESKEKAVQRDVRNEGNAKQHQKGRGKTSPSTTCLTLALGFQAPGNGPPHGKFRLRTPAEHVQRDRERMVWKHQDIPSDIPSLDARRKGQNANNETTPFQAFAGVATRTTIRLQDKPGLL